MEHTTIMPFCVSPCSSVVMLRAVLESSPEGRRTVLATNDKERGIREWGQEELGVGSE